MATKPCTISQQQRAASDKAVINALDGASASGAGSILHQMAERSHHIMSAWIEAGRPNNRTAIDRIVRKVGRP